LIIILPCGTKFYQTLPALGSVGIEYLKGRDNVVIPLNRIETVYEGASELEVGDSFHIHHSWAMIHF